MDAIPEAYDDHRFAVMSAIVPIVQFDMVLPRLGASPRRPPTLHAGSSADLLAWGVDSVVAVARLLLSGQILGAAAMIRNQLELWMSQRAESLGIEQQKGESTIAFAARTWSHPDVLHDQWFENHRELVSNMFEEGEAGDLPVEDPPDWVNVVNETERDIEHLHGYRSNGMDICPPLTYALLSEFLHLRVFADAAMWDMELLAANDNVREDVALAGGVVCDAIFLAMREIRLAAIGLAKRRGLRSAVELLSSGMDAISIGDTHTDLPYEAIPFGAGRMRETIIPPVAALAPLLPREGLSRRMVSVVGSLANDYAGVLRKERPAGRLYQDDELLVRSFAWHRMGSIAVAEQSLRAERAMLGPEFDESSLGGRAAKWVMLTESSGLLALWHPTPGVRSAAAALGSSLRSAYWLWLEDDDRAMAVLRSSLEYVARLRTWRKRPQKAQMLDARSQTTPRDWITQAGWRRLSLLNRILGEFAHARKMKDWPAARQLLAKLQINVDEERAIFTARGSAIDFTAALAAREVVALISDVNVDISAALGRILEEMDYRLDEEAEDVEAQFAHIWAVRSRRSDAA